MAGNGAFDILLVEDDLGDAHLVKVALRSGPINCTLHHVKDGADALSFLTRKAPEFQEAPRPHLIILDLNTPRMSGKDLLRRIKADAGLATIPVVILTTSEAERDIAECYGLGANSFISKPIDVDQFMHAIHAVQSYWFSIVKLPAS